MTIIALSDIETTPLPEADKFHMGVVKRLDTNVTKTYFNLEEMMEDNKDVDKWVFHNGLGFDGPKINQLLGYEAIPMSNIIDTMVVSKLVDFGKFNGHSLKELGLHLGTHKGDYTGDFTVCDDEMIEYCKQDVVVLESVWEYLKPYIMDPSWAEAMRLEHDMATISHEMQGNGFKFKMSEAEEMLGNVTEDMKTLEDGFHLAFPPKLVADRTILMRKRKDGKLYPNVLKAMSEAPKVEVSDDGKELTIFKYKEFNPASTKQRVDVLWDAGWKPTAKTKGHKKFLMEQRRSNRW